MQNAECKMGQDFLLSAPTYAHTASLRLALSGLLFYATSWRFPRSSQEGNQGFSPWIPLISRRSADERRGFCFCKRPPSWAHISHAQDGFAVGKVFCFLVGEAISLPLARRLSFGGRTKALPYGVRANMGA